MTTLHSDYSHVSNNNNSSTITEGWLLVGNPMKIFGILVLYLLFCLKLGPWLMEHRKAFVLKKTLMVYNVVQIFASLYLFSEGAAYMFTSEFNTCCQGLDDPSSPRAIRIAKVVWFYYMLKFVDLLDTIFFVLRKSNRQISSLHLFHHTIVPLVAWYATTFVPGGQAALFVTINCFVHIVMYAYYLLAGLGDKYKKYLWWKQYLTILQLVQFLINGIHSINSLFYDCSYPQNLKFVTIGFALIFLNMFGQFYYETYVKNENVKKNANE